MAEIFEKADSNSAGFDYSPNPETITEIYKNIDIINSTGIPLFANNLPFDSDKYDVNEYGVKYIDLRDPEASVEKYGYPAGTKVKDLKFLCHSSDDDESNFEVLCDDSKDVCLSTMLLDKKENYNTGYNCEGSYIVSGNNANIVLGGKELACSGGHKGYKYARESMYKNMESLMNNNVGYLNNNQFRDAIPNEIRDSLRLSKREYLELYSAICNLDSMNNICDVKLKSGRVVSRDDVVSVISSIRDYMVEPDVRSKYGYINEFVVYNPKIEGVVVSGDINRFTSSKYPLVLV
jgi:hypothetical protein